MSHPPRPRVVVLGAGFAGLAAAEALGDAVAVTVVARSPHFEFLPNIHELVSGVKTPELLRLPAKRIVERAGHRFVTAEIEAIDPVAKQVRLADGSTLDYDVLIVALGGENASHGVPGVAEHALPFKTVDDCTRIGRRLRQLARTRRTQEVVIVGGGLEGVEALGEVLRRHRGDRLHVHLVEADLRLLPEAPHSLDEAVRKLAAPYAVHFVTGSRVARVEADAVILESGASIPSQATLWTGGPRAPALLAEAGIAPEPGAWAPVEGSLQSRLAPDVFVAGDAADLLVPIAKQAYHALDMGRCAATNAERALRDRSLHRFRPAEKPMLLSFGDLGGFFVAGGFVLAGPALGSAKEAVFEAVMAQLDRRGPWDAGLGALARIVGAGRGLVWPALTSPSAWLRLARVSIL